ncbi:MAG: hypothetical protein A3K05_00015 [Candidatus Doudnabacteria bacterium RIFCSPHIGHO2_01_48_18]|uniref:Uncharacterized protein n=1 Tax=Candidatus Doudnabacteria bacterium RIFCSPLOWO2_02_FULL_48_13 TaxID=1817845 RepID=A0A1F5QD38_9BACT|nr:MAG: hypothetical protein A3K05_00015 [Candidatus Doudnabacteria bacterium RIFCSPHIGHO2_01_48_18]OGF00122.1 MAG: hypothetical protein A3J05_03420 [Candidatus Doudnabacteria bacterium RIFCSPLOWO2_02_FULL_48_13]
MDINFELRNSTNPLKYHTSCRRLAISIEDSISLALFWKKQNIETKKSVWEILAPPCSYKTLVVSINRWYKLALLVLACLIA